MALSRKFKRTTTAHKRPKPLQDMSEGQIALNVNEESPALFITANRESTDVPSLVKIGPAHVGAEPPLLTDGARYCIGELWYNPETGVLKVRYRDRNNMGLWGNVVTAPSP